VKVTCSSGAHVTVMVKVKVKLSLNRPIGFQQFEASRISRQSAHEGGEVVSLTHRPALRASLPSQGRSLVLISVKR
jgi:hypothetical protein